MNIKKWFDQIISNTSKEIQEEDPEEINFYNEGHLHEALHTSFIITEMIGNYLIDSKAAEHFPDIKAAAEKAQAAVADLYQLIGSKE